MVNVPQVGTQEPQWNFQGKWQVCAPETVGNFSAVGYFFGRQLHQPLDVPVGLINNAWGGSACEAWVRRDLLASDAKFKTLMESWTQREAQFEAARRFRPRRPQKPERPASPMEGVMSSGFRRALRSQVEAGRPIGRSSA